MKSGLRVIGFDDGFFIPKKKGQTVLVGVVYNFSGRVEGILSTKIKVDSLDSTRKIVYLLKNSKFLPQISVIFLSGINFAGFNLVDIEKLSEKLSLPIVIVFRKFPNLKKIKKALERFKDSKKRLSLLEKAGHIHELNSIHFQCISCSVEEAKALIRKTLLYSNIPEPLRLAHLMASGISIGESTRPK